MNIDNKLYMILIDKQIKVSQSLDLWYYLQKKVIK